MSFLGDLVNSIGTNKAPPPPPPRAPSQKSDPRQPVISSANPYLKSVPKSPHIAASTIPPPNPLKRKNDDEDARAVERPTKPAPVAVQTNGVKARVTTPVVNSVTNNAKPVLQARPQAAPTAPQSTNAAKAPPKGSFADIMARAKQAQEQRSGSQVGMIKHQARSKDKVSKLAERRRQEQEKSKTEKSRPNQKQVPSERGGKKRSASPQKKAEAVKVPRAPRPPLHAPSSGYKGTMGMASKRTQDVAANRGPKRSRYDDYLGTDEEEDSEMEEDDDGYGYGSDQSSDMEGGFDDIEDEERKALRVAKEDDARELAMESKLKSEKEERRRKLAAMAKKAR